MEPINFQPIFDYIDRAIQDLKTELTTLIRTEIRSEMGEVKTQIANLSAQVKKHDEDSHISNYRLDRLENWATHAGKKIHLPIKL